MQPKSQEQYAAERLTRALTACGVTSFAAVAADNGTVRLCIPVSECDEIAALLLAGNAARAVIKHGIGMIFPKSRA